MYPIKARRHPFGQAAKPGKSGAFKVASSARWENVGGIPQRAGFQPVRAIYGSSDHAQEDHGNDALCMVVTRELQVTTEPRRITTENTVTFETVSEWTPPSVEQITSWARRATKLGMSLLDYAAKYNLPVSPC